MAEQVRTDFGSVRNNSAMQELCSGKQLLDDFSTKLAELFESSTVVECEFIVVQSQQMQQRHVKIANRVNTLYC